MTQNEFEIALVFFGGGMFFGSWITATVHLVRFRWRARISPPPAAQPATESELRELVAATGELVQRLDRRLERLEERADFSERLLETRAPSLDGRVLVAP